MPLILDAQKKWDDFLENKITNYEKLFLTRKKVDNSFLFSGVEKSKVANRPTRVLAKFRADRSHP